MRRMTIGKGGLRGRMLSETDPAVEVVDLGERVPPRLVGIAWHRDRRRTRAAEAFVELARRITADAGLTAEAA